MRFNASSALTHFTQGTARKRAAPNQLTNALNAGGAPCHAVSRPLHRPLEAFETLEGERQSAPA